MRLHFYYILILVTTCNYYMQAQLNDLFSAWQKDPLLKSASFSAFVANAKTSEVIFEYNSKQALVPASTLKLVTTAAALQILGPTYRFETKIYYSGEFDKVTGILHGDLIIRGSGDPTLQSEIFYKENLTDLWAKALKELGLKEVTGSVIGDASYFERRVPNNWIWEDISNYYGAVPCALSYRDNKFTVTYESLSEGSSATIKTISPVYSKQAYNISSTVTAKGTSDEAYAYGDPFSFSREIKGNIPPNRSNYEVDLSLPDPALLCAEDLCKSLVKTGITCKTLNAVSSYTLAPLVSTTQLLYTHYSPTLDKIVYYTNQKSNNLYCESMLRAVGRGNADRGLLQVKQHWAARGLDTTELYMEDACGLARINTVTTRFETQLLCKIYRDSSVYRIMNGSLPVAGRQGSMSNLGKGSFIEGNLRAKTGYMSRVRAYAGYVKSKKGQDLAFTVFLNNYNGSAREAKLKIEKFLLALGEL